MKGSNPYSSREDAGCRCFLRHRCPSTPFPLAQARPKAYCGQQAASSQKVRYIPRGRKYHPVQFDKTGCLLAMLEVLPPFCGPSKLFILLGRRGSQGLGANNVVILLR